MRWMQLAMFAVMKPGLEDDSGVVSMLRRRASDAKINVRKASLLAIENICQLERQNVNEQVSMALIDNTNRSTLCVLLLCLLTASFVT